MSILQVTDLKKYYGAEPGVTRALDGVTLSIEQGSLLLLWAPPAAANPRCCI